MEKIQIGTKELSPREVFSLLNAKISLSPEAERNIRANRQALEQLLENAGERYYGINTGFGSLYQVDISAGDIRLLQTNLLRSHACGVGAAAPRQIVKLTLLLKIISLAKACSGVRLEIVLRLIDLFNHDILPVIPMTGSLGASGDLAPLAHLSLALIGEGEVIYKREQMPAARAMMLAGLDIISLEAKEGLALINGTQYSLAYLIHGIRHAHKLSFTADLCTAVSMEAYDCHPSPLDEQIHFVRNQHGQIQSALRINEWLKGSIIQQQSKAHLQDPYSMRCAPQVQGAVWDVLAYCETIATREINSVTDNPLVFHSEQEARIVSGGNFHAQPLAFAADFLCIALSELGSISERRSFLLLSGQRGLPAALAVRPGLESGMMICQYTAAALVNRNKILAHPASTDTIVTSAGQEDHVSMAANAGIKLFEITKNVSTLLAIEWMLACQAIESRKPLDIAPAIDAHYKAYRELVPALSGDRSLSLEIDVTENFLSGIVLERD